MSVRLYSMPLLLEHNMPRALFELFLLKRYFRYLPKYIILMIALNETTDLLQSITYISFQLFSLLATFDNQFTMERN